MKKKIKIFALVFAVLFTALFSFAGCDLTRKINGAEINFPAKISDAKSFSFKMNVNYKKGDATTVINMDCYKRTAEDGKEQYAYVYTCPERAAHESYKNVYANNKLYEVVNFTKNTGTYYVKDGISEDDEKNILYQVKQNILLLSVAALLKKATKETLNGEQVYRYDVDVNDKTISIWYNTNALVKCYVKFEGEDGEEDEEYTLLLSDYTFNEELPAEVFSDPSKNVLGYVESPLSFETWMEIITSFGSKLVK